MILNTPDFSLQATLESGQVFGFHKSKDGWYEGNIPGSFARLYQKQDRLFIRHENPKISASDIRNFFHLDYDLNAVYELIENEEKLLPVLSQMKGLRIIRQNPWEALACFIISSNNNVKRIQLIRRNLVDYYGGQENFPDPCQIANSKESILGQLGLGYRASYLLKTAQAVASDPFFIENVRKVPYEEAKLRLLKLPGVGPKVAECVLLFGFQKYEAFPVDVWIARVMRKLYFKNREVLERKIQSFGQKRWRELAGYIQQYLFHGARNHLF